MQKEIRNGETVYIFTTEEKQKLDKILNKVSVLNLEDLQ